MFCKILIILNIVIVLECMDHKYFANDSKNQMDTGQEAIVKRDIERQDRIYGGVKCPAEEFKTIVSIREDHPFRNHKCGATLINRNWALSAAHCHKYNHLPYYIMAGIGTSNNARGVTSKVSKWYHPEVPNQEKKAPYDYDIALLLLETPIEETEFIKYVKLPTKDLGDIRQFCPEGLVKGWGRMEGWNKPETERDLQCFNTSINSDDCKFDFVTNDNMLVCLLDPNKKGGVCLGDSGGPLMCNGMQIGTCSVTTMTFKGLACDTAEPQGYTRVDKYLGFINDIMKTHTPRKGNSPNVNCMSISMWLLVFFNVFRQFLYLM